MWKAWDYLQQKILQSKLKKKNKTLFVYNTTFYTRFSSDCISISLKVQFLGRIVISKPMKTTIPNDLQNEKPIINITSKCL